MFNSFYMYSNLERGGKFPDNQKKCVECIIRKNLSENFYNMCEYYMQAHVFRLLLSNENIK